MVTDDEAVCEVFVRRATRSSSVFDEEERVLGIGIGSRLSEERNAYGRSIGAVTRPADQADRPVPGASGKDPTAALLHVIGMPMMPSTYSSTSTGIYPG